MLLPRDSRQYSSEGYSPFASIIPLVIQLVILMGLIAAIRSGMNDSAIDMRFLGVDLSLVLSEEKGWLILLADLCRCVRVAHVRRAERRECASGGAEQLE